MLKIIVTNFENLINEEEAISTNTMLLIDNLRRKNYHLLVTTHRDFRDVLSYNKSYPFIDYIISLSGSIIFDVNKNKIISKKNISSKELKQIEKLFPKKDLELSSYEDKIYQIKIKNTSPLANLETLTAINIDRDLFLTSNKINMRQALEKIIQNKKYSLSVIAYDIADYSLFPLSSENYILKKADKNLKKLLKREKNYIIEENIEEILSKFL